VPQAESLPLFLHQCLFLRDSEIRSKAAGEGGVALSLSILREELERTLKLLGCYSISKLNSSFIEMDVARFRHRASSQLTAR
jgi:FMN-dependent dehydrogenase